MIDPLYTFFEKKIEGGVTILKIQQILLFKKNARRISVIPIKEKKNCLPPKPTEYFGGQNPIHSH